MKKLILLCLVTVSSAFADIGDHVDWKDSNNVTTTRVVLIGISEGKRTYSLYPIKNGKVGEVANRYNGKDILKESELKEALKLEIDREKSVSNIKNSKSRSTKSKADEMFDEMEKGPSDEDLSRIDEFIKELREL